MKTALQTYTAYDTFTMCRPANGTGSGFCPGEKAGADILAIADDPPFALDPPFSGRNG